MKDIRLIFFYKQKTEYEMRISDWRSDVCSSDLEIAAVEPAVAKCLGRDRGILPIAERHMRAAMDDLANRARRHRSIVVIDDAGFDIERRPARRTKFAQLVLGLEHGRDRRQFGLSVEIEQSDRSEEHTSELQSLMRISYAVFCLKK